MSQQGRQVERLHTLWEALRLAMDWSPEGVALQDVLNRVAHELRIEYLEADDEAVVRQLACSAFADSISELPSGEGDCTCVDDFYAAIVTFFSSRGAYSPIDEENLRLYVGASIVGSAPHRFSDALNRLLAQGRVAKTEQGLVWRGQPGF